jgi:hypothetical protein
MGFCVVKGLVGVGVGVEVGVEVEAEWFMNC